MRTALAAGLYDHRNDRHVMGAAYFDSAPDIVNVAGSEDYSAVVTELAPALGSAFRR